MEIGTPIWNAGERSYSFPVLKCNATVEANTYYEKSQQNLDLPVIDSITPQIIQDLLEKTKKYFTNPLTLEKVLRHLRHSSVNDNLPKSTGWFKLQWQPSCFTIKSNDFLLSWKVSHYTETEPLIPAEFTAPSRSQSPAPEQPQVRSIQIHDALIPVGDLPLSDLPPLAFGMEESDPVREETKRRIREARLKVQLAKLKAQRMEQKYYERYGTTAEDSEGSTDFSTDSEMEEHSFENHSS